MTATLVGVFLALILNEAVSSYKLRKQKSIATANILMEIEQNQESVKRNIDKHKAMLSVFQFIQGHVDDQNRLIASVDEMGSFRKDHPTILAIEDSTLLDNGLYHYQGEANLNFDLSFIDLTNLAWETVKNSGLANTYDFNCLLFLEKLDRIAKETLIQEKKVIEMLKSSSEYEDEEMNHEIEFLIEYESGLLEGYANSEEQLKDCD